DRRTEIQEWVHVDLVVEHAEPATNYQIPILSRLISEAEPWRHVISIWRENGIDALPLDQQPAPTDENRQVFAIVMQRPEVFIPQPQVHVQFSGHLPGILTEKVKAIHPNVTFRISHRDGGRRYVTGKKVGQSARWIGAGACARPRRSRKRPGKVKASQRAAEIKLVHSRVAYLPAEPELVFPYVVGKNVCQHSCDVIAPFRWCDPDLLKPGDGNVRRSRNWLSVDERVRAQEQA